MTDIAGNIADYELKHIKPNVQIAQAELTVGASGAVGSQDTDDPGLSFTKNGGTGDYTLAFPKCPKARVIGVSLISPAGTVEGVNLVALDATAGTFNFVTNNGGGTATNPASSDKVHVTLALYKLG